MIQRITPQEYFLGNNEFKEGLKWGAMLVILGIVIGALIVYLSRK